MEGFAFFVGGVLPYIAVLIFVVGMVYRLNSWWKSPQPGKMTLFPAPKGGMAGSIIKEVLFFPSLFKGDRTLWYMSWIFHAMVALVAVGHLRVVTGAIDAMLVPFIGEGGVTIMSTTAGGAAGIVMLATGVLLLVRRFSNERVAQITTFSDVFALLLLLAIVVTGDLMRFSGTHFDLTLTHTWALSLLTFSPQVPQNGMFLVHALLAQVLFMYIPFSKILHFGGVFFTQALVQRR